MSEPTQTFGQILNAFRERHDLTLPQLAALIGSGNRAVDYWLAKTNPKEPRKLAQQAILATLEAYDRKHKTCYGGQFVGWVK